MSLVKMTVPNLLIPEAVQKTFFPQVCSLNIKQYNKSQEFSM